MPQNLIAVYGDVPELVEKQSLEIIQTYLQQERDDFNFVKFNLYEHDISTIIEEMLMYLQEKKFQKIYQQTLINY